MVEIRYTRNLFLRCINVIFLFAFASLYVQIPGLYGKNGILPARTQLDHKIVLFDEDSAKQIQKKPTLLWLSPYLGVDTEYMMDILCLSGMFLAFTGFASQKFCIKPVHSALWSLYYSLYQVGQTFMWFQWDILLLEAGFLCIIIAPWHHKTQRSTKKQQTVSAPSDRIRFWLVRWLLFRLMFSSGIVKLTSGCPTWWGLTALNIHFESMCIPTPLAWYAHHLPTWFLKLNTVFSNFAEIIVPPLFFFPIRSVRIVAFFIQVFLQVAIILTGNFNFFNYLTIALCLSLVDDDFICGSSKKSSWKTSSLKCITTLAVYGALLYATGVLYGLKIAPGGIIDSKITFTPADFEKALASGMPLLIALASLSFILTCTDAFGILITQNVSKLGRIMSLLSTMFYIFIAMFFFTDSLVPFSTLHPSANMTFVPVETRELHNKLSHLHLTNAYGLFRRMTGVGGRQEIIIEGSHTMEGPWLEYNFKYKPGNVNDSLPFVAPHQPRLDWQMWFAALGTYHQNPWIMSLTYRLLTGQQEVLGLIDNTRNPFASAPPKYIRANLYHYHYTPWTQRDKQATWTRQKVAEYFPIFSKDHVPLLEYLKNFKILDTGREEQVSPTAINFLDNLRKTFATIEPPFLLLSLIITGFAIILFRGLPASSHHQASTKPPAQRQTTQTKNKKKSK